MHQLTKKDIVAEVMREGLTPAEALTIVDRVFLTMREAFLEKRDVEIRDFGTFRINQSKPRVGRNPNKPGSSFIIPARNVVKFRVGKHIEAKLNPKA
jgi:nucleoid DNA-binding protein